MDMQRFRRTVPLVICGLVAIVMAGCPATPEEMPIEHRNSAPSAPPGNDSGETNGAATFPKPKLQYVPPGLTDEELREGWISLFDGTSLFGWNVPETTNWHVEDQTIVADAGEISLLETKFRFDDFEFRCDFHLEKDGNSGVFLRSSHDLKSPATDTYELNICDSHATHGTGSLVGRHVTENVPPVEGDWHTFRILCDGPKIHVWLDGDSILEFEDSSENLRLTGTIGLQMNQGRVAFRNVFLRPINNTELFNGRNINGFHSVPGSKSTFEVQDQAIHVTDGPGFLETDGTFQDFILHVEARNNDAMARAAGKSPNSGVFFRAMKGTLEAPSHGYEMQIQNTFLNGDRTQPEDHGTGAIFRRAPARYVVADDNAWFVATLIAQGDRFATFVNGYQVVGWQDDREPDANPRRGRRLDAGHISLQGHDPTTDLNFRSLRIHELSAK